MKYTQRVHIIAIGNDILERIIIPPEKGHADKVILITMEGPDLYAEIVEKARTTLISQHIVSSDMVIVRTCNLFDFTAVLELFGQLIQAERCQNNTVFISLSTGGKLVAAAGMLACVLFGAEPYFLKLHYQTMSIPLAPEIFPVPRLSFEPPKRNLIVFLNKLIKKQHEENSKGIKGIKGITKNDCLKFMAELHPEEQLSNTSGDYNKLKYRYLNPLEALHYIQTQRSPRTQIQITDEGTFGWRIFRAFYQID